MAVHIDLYDKKILCELDIDARASASSIARRIKLPKETVNYRIKRLMKKGYIKYFYTIINASLLGYKYCKIFIKLHRTTPDVKQAIIDYIQHQSNCANLRVLEGTYDLVFIMMYKNSQELNDFLRKFSARHGEYVVKKNIHNIITTHKLNQKVFLDKQSSKRSFQHTDGPVKHFDTTDISILTIIATHARTNLLNIANQINQKSQMVRYRVKKLEEEGVIVSYSTAIDYKKLMREYVQINLSLKDHTKIASIIEFFDSEATCAFAYELIGEYDLSLEIYVQNYDQLRRVVNEFKNKFINHYISYDISHIFQEYVINWLPCPRKTISLREVVEAQ